MVTIKFSMDAAAFEDHFTGELSRTLRKAESIIEWTHDNRNGHFQLLTDSNGNTIGHVEITTQEEDV